MRVYHFFKTWNLIFLYSMIDSLLGIPNYFNSDSFMLGFRLGLTTLSFCSICVLLFLHYLMCGCFCNVLVFLLLCVCVFVRCGCFC
jgi:hypothetical protein